jgi:uncharacterized protein (DUF1015 family)
MVDIRGFQGLRFNAAITGTLDNVLTPPYDVIDSDERQRLANSCPYNMTHVILPVAEGKETAYEKSARLFHEWVTAGVLCPETEPSLYLLRQQFTGPDGAAFERKAFFALMKLPEPDEHYILGHERTFDKPVQDRFNLLQAVQANLEPIFVMYSDPANRVADRLFQPLATEAPLLQAKTADQVMQELWRVPCPEYLAQHFLNQTLYIADGHHRFKTACAWRDACRKNGSGGDGVLQPYDYIMAGFVSFEEPGLKIYAAHRVVPKSFNVDFGSIMSKFQDYFECRQLSEVSGVAGLAEDPADACVFIMHTKDNGAWLLRLKEDQRTALVGTDRKPAWQALDVAVLHRGILNQLLGISDGVDLIYEKDSTTAISLVDRGEASLAFLMRPTRPEQVRDCAEAFEPMPQKSTYFFPKLPSGAVIYSLT